MPASVDLVIKSFSRDYIALRYLLRSIALNLSGYRRLYLFLDNEACFNEFQESIRDFIRPEWQIQLCDAYSRSGYLQQQLYKLNFFKFSDADFILPLDSDMIVYRESTVEDWLFDGKAVIPFGNWDSLCSYPPVGLHSKIVEMGLEVRHSIDQMIFFIKERSHELGCTNLNESNGALRFAYDGSIYSLDPRRPHRAWPAAALRSGGWGSSPTPTTCGMPHHVSSLRPSGPTAPAWPPTTPKPQKKPSVSIPRPSPTAG